MSHIKSHRKQNSIPPLPDNHSNNFDFDLWASQVKRQMLACLRKRGSG